MKIGSNRNRNRVKEQNNRVLGNTIASSKDNVNNTQRNWLSLSNNQSGFNDNLVLASRTDGFNNSSNVYKTKNKLKYFNKQIYSSPSDIYYVNNYTKSNSRILSKILDSKQKFAPNSPSNKQVIQKEQQQIDNDNKNDTVSKSDNHDYLLYCLESFLQYADIEFENNKRIESKIKLILDILSNSKKINYSENNDNNDEIKEYDTIIRLGGLVSLFLMLRKHIDQIDQKTKDNIILSLLSLLKGYNLYEELLLSSCLDICSLLSPSKLVLENIGLISMFLTDFNYPLLQKSSFGCLMSLGQEGIKMLIELSYKDYQDCQSYILQNLINTPHIQKLIICRALVNDVFSNNHERRLAALSALSRMKDLVNDSVLLNKLCSCFNDSKIRKGFIASILRTSGDIGEKLLIEQLDKSNDPNVKIAIINVLSYRVKKQETYLRIKLDENNTFSIANKMPGLFFNYHGMIAPYINDNNKDIKQLFEDEGSNDISVSLSLNEINKIKINRTPTITNSEYLEVSTRDFLSTLQRLLPINFDSFLRNNDYCSYNSSVLNSINVEYSSSDYISKYSNLYICKKAINNDSSLNCSSSYYNKRIEIDNDYYPISNNVIRILTKSLKNPLAKIREESAIALGMIGSPEAMNAIDQLSKAIEDKDANVKAKVLWAIGNLCPCGEVSNMLTSIVECLNSNMWKIKLASLYCIRKIGDYCANFALPILIKQLKESPINKNIIAETMISLGQTGENALLHLISNANETNFKLITAIVRSLGFVNEYSPNMDFIIECLFRYSESFYPQVRYSAICSINAVSQKANEGINYLKRKNLIPYYYDKMKDKDTAIQQYATNCLKIFGPQAELIFIEGLLNDPNAIVRHNCGVGLSDMGVHNLRTIIIGLHDGDEGVRKGLEKVIVNNMPIGAVIAHFNKEKQLLSLKISIQDLFDKNISLFHDTQSYFNILLSQIDKFPQGDTKSYFL